MMVSGLGGSLDIVCEAIHPASKRQLYHYLRASYTAGTMAGLGFATALLGLSVGIVVAFLLWRRRQEMPYYVEWCSTPMLRNQISNCRNINNLNVEQELSPAYPGPPYSYQNHGVRY
jgi:hypothetical protein